MTREQYEDRFWKVSDEKWNELVEKGLVPEDTPKAWAKWNEMMKTRKPIPYNDEHFDDYPVDFTEHMCPVKIRTSYYKV